MLPGSAGVSTAVHAFKKDYRKKNALLGLIFNSRENKKGISLLPSAAFSHLLTESCSRIDTLYLRSYSILKKPVEMKGLETNSWKLYDKIWLIKK